MPRRSSPARPIPPPSSRRAQPSSTRRTQSGEGIVAQLTAIEHAGGSGTLQVARGRELNVSGLDKVYFPDDGVTKGDLMRYYTTLAPLLLPLIVDRPLVLKRTPEGITGEMFFQQNAPDHVPDGVRVEDIAGDGNEAQRRFIGGDLTTLLYTVQLGCISVDPWMSRVGSLDTADYAILDLDPGPGATFRRVVDAARWIHETLTDLALHGVAKTSGSRGIHIAVPLPAGTSYETSIAVAQLAAAHVVEAHPRETTVQRSLQNRPHGTVYVDCLQNVRGKSVVATYAARARAGATVSTPLDWREVTATLDPNAFTVATVPERVARLGDLWGPHIRRRNSARAIRAAANPDRGAKRARATSR